MRTGASDREGLKDGHEIWIDGEWVEHVTTHPSLKPIVDVKARMYDMAHEARFGDAFSDMQGNEKNSIFYRPPHDAKDWDDKRATLD
jgi:4-hydroxyphenylacetate 3-monooxygenase